MKSEAELAGVLGHEIIHVTEKHTIRAIQKGKAGADGRRRNARRQQGALRQAASTRPPTSSMAGFGRGEELEADEKGIVLANKAGYEPHGLPSFLSTLLDRNKNSTTEAADSSRRIPRCRSASTS